MNRNTSHVHIIYSRAGWLVSTVATWLVACLPLLPARAQSVVVPADSVLKAVADTVMHQADDFELAPLDSLITDETVRQLQEQGQAIASELESELGKADTTASAVLLKPQLRHEKRDWATWQPDPQRAMWLAMVIPGAGQIYNRKFWKLPLFYGGFMGCIYALTWNNKMYKEYAQAYLDIMDDDPGTRSYMNFMTLGRQITPQNEARYQTVFKKRKDRYRRWRDMSFFVMCGVYALSVIDAYVDAELSVFDISHDLSMKVEPAVMGSPLGNNPLQASSVGVNCSISF